MTSVQPRILIVDDERKMCRSIEILLREEGSFETLIATDYYEAIQKLKQPVDLVLSDLTMPGKDGIELLKAVKGEHPDLPVILMTAFSTVQSAVTSIKEGAFDYIVKPFENERLLSLIRKALGSKSVDFTQFQKGSKTRFGDILGQNKKMQDVFYRIQRAADTDSTVLIMGESGTGKELVAKAIHFSGSRKSKAFIALNCAAVPESLLESELFGHEKGAFSGAIKQREGKFELADHGTLFLDEIGEMTPSLQVKLLRVIQEKEFERVGGKETIKVDVRIIAATNRNLAQAVKHGQFREDLFYRLNVITIDIPPLRERREDLPLLIDHFLFEKTRRIGVPPKKLSSEARNWLMSYDYPGNIRELENLIERAVVISRDSTISITDLPVKSSAALNWQDVSLPADGGIALLEEIKTHLERDLIFRAVQLYPDKSHTELAEILGTSRRVLESRLKIYNVTKPNGR